MYKISLNVKSFDLESLKQTLTYLFPVFSFFTITQIQQKMNPKKCQKITVLRSPHIDKKSREQFQIITHKRTFILKLADKNSVLLFLEILKNSKFIGVEIEIFMEFSTF
uniref:Ribosomal protein S10 n=1 Tax=Micractinium pusillum TaxID=126839 RepID=A0A650F2L3_9CHLO|nr:ribosomal protein S10 [Micractinium pusillum]